jgi:hypothetical protein
MNGITATLFYGTGIYVGFAQMAVFTTILRCLCVSGEESELLAMPVGG